MTYSSLYVSCLKKQPSGGVISDPDPILTPKIASKNFCKAMFLFA